MSRVGKKPIPLPEKVEVEVDGRTVRVKGPNGGLERVLHPAVTVQVADRQVSVTPVDESRESRALWGLSRTLVANMVEGVSQGFSKELEIVGVGYRAERQGDAVKLSLGFSRPITYQPPEGVTVEVPSPQAIVVRGIDKEMVGQCAAEIRLLRPPEPYKGKGVRYKNERVRRKVRKGALGGMGPGV
ncbi:MAG: 50S ribosomal protein L6 [bacterium]